MYVFGGRVGPKKVPDRRPIGPSGLAIFQTRLDRQKRSDLNGPTVFLNTPNIYMLV